MVRDGPVKREVSHFDAVFSRSLFDGPPTALAGPAKKPYLCEKC